MKKTYTLLLFLILFTSTNSFSQKRSNNWYFGVFAGLDFNSGSPVELLNGALNTSEGCSAISDTSGNLLFYTDGITVWNKNHQQMPNGDNLMGDVSSSQSALIVPQPGHPDIYYVFTTDADAGPDGFRYSVVDMSLDGGLGDITTQKNIFVEDSVTEKLAAVEHPGGGVWLLIHKWGSNAFYTYDLTSAGINLTPVISKTGFVHSTAPPGALPYQSVFGQMKFSPGGKRVAVAIGYENLFEVFDFNIATGVVSSPVPLPMGDHCYGIEFSPNGKLLYGAHYDNVSDYYFLDQFNLLAGNAAAVLASKTNLGTSYDGIESFRALQIASDGKIYVAKGFNGLLGVVNSPDSVGTACNYADNSVSLGGNTGALGLPGFVQKYSDCAGVIAGTVTALRDTVCPGFIGKLTATGNSGDVQWQSSATLSDFIDIPDADSIEYSSLITQTTWYRVYVSNGSCADTSNAHQVVLAPSPVANFDYQVTGKEVTFDGSGSSGDVTIYAWDFDDMQASSDTNPVHTFAKDTIYHVCLTVFNGSNCSFTLCRDVTVGVTGMNSFLANENLNINPNPANDYFLIENKMTKKIESVEVFDLLGKKLLTQQFLKSNNEQLKIDISDLSSGMYLIRIKTPDAAKYNLPIIKR